MRTLWWVGLGRGEAEREGEREGGRIGIRGALEGLGTFTHCCLTIEDLNSRWGGDREGRLGVGMGRGRG